jgi:hypothetical protein
MSRILSDRSAVLTGDTWATRFLNLGVQMATAYKSSFLSLMIPTMFQFIWPCSFRGEDFSKSANPKQKLPVVTMFVNGSGQNDQP